MFSAETHLKVLFQLLHRLIGGTERIVIHGGCQVRVPVYPQAFEAVVLSA